MPLTEAHLQFVAETVGNGRENRNRSFESLREHPDRVDQLLEDARLKDRVIQDREVLVRVSPYLIFSVLLRQVWRDVQTQGFVRYLRPLNDNYFEPPPH